MTECTACLFDFQDLASREVVASFNGGPVTSDAAALLLREVEAKLGLLEQFAGCFSDHRDQDAIEHSVLDLVKQRV